MSREREGWDGGSLALLLGSAPKVVEEFEGPAVYTGICTGRSVSPKLEYRHIVPSPWSKPNNPSRQILRKYGTYHGTFDRDTAQVLASIVAGTGSTEDDT